MRFLDGFLSVVTITSGIFGSCFLIAGGVGLVFNRCEVLEVVSVIDVLPATHGIHMCNVNFVYSSSRLPGTLYTQCPTRAGGDIAVCYSETHPNRFTAAEFETDLNVESRQLIFIMIYVGAGMVALCMLSLLAVGGLATRPEPLYEETKIGLMKK